MIPALSLMIGMYIITRMVEILSNKQNSTATAIFAIITILIVLICVFDIYTVGSSVPNLGQ